MSRKKTRKQMGLSKSQLLKIEDDAIKKMVVLSAAYLMDEFDYDKQKIIDFYDGVVRYCYAVNEKTISINKVKQIIEEYTGIKM